MCNSRSNNNLYKFFKINYFIFIICVSFLIYQSVNLFIELISGKTVVNISVGYIRNGSLPAITLCPSSFDFSKLSLLNDNIFIMYKQYLKMVENLNERRRRDIQDNLKQILVEALKIYFNSTENNIKIDKILNFLTPHLDKINKTMLITIFYRSSAYGEIDNDLIKIEGQHDENYIMKSLPIESLLMLYLQSIPVTLKCYTLFSHSESSWDNIKMVFDRFLISLRLDYHSIPITPSMDIKLLMHSPNILSIEGFSYVSPGYVYVIEFWKWNIKRLGKGYDTDCREYDPKIYTRSDCIFDCYQERAKYNCRTEDVVSYPLLKKKIYFENNDFNLSKCDIKMNIMNEILEYCYGKCNRECHITYYSFTISKFKQIDLQQVHFLFKHNEMPDLTIRHIPEMPLLTFICNFGGILGMWLGVSFVDSLNHVSKLLYVKILSMISMMNVMKNNIYIMFISKKNKRKKNQIRIMTTR